MTPKEKAKELIELYYNLFSVELENTIDHREAQQCALIAVDEILNNDNNFFNTYSQNDYWLQVKQELLNL